MRNGRWLLAVGAVFVAGLALGRWQGARPAPEGGAALAAQLAALPPTAAGRVANPSGAQAPALSALDDPSLAELCTTVTLTTEQQQMIGVRTGLVQRLQGQRTLRLFGRVAADESRLHVLNAGSEGFIREVAPAVTTGSAVRKGQWLATFSSPEARSPIQAYLITLESLERAQRGGGDAPPQMAAANASLNLARDRLVSLGLSQAQIDEIGRSRIDLPTHLRITAPVDGIVLERHVSIGQKFSKGTEWYRIADLSRVWVVAEAFESDAHLLKPGMRAQVTLPGTDQTVTATVTELLPQFDAATRTLKVRLEAPNPRLALRPDTPVEVMLSATTGEALAVPTDALVDSGLRKMVFVERAPGTFEPRRVRTGRRFNGQVEVLEGLMAGERVVVAGTFLVDSESRIKAGAGNLHAAHGHSMAEGPPAAAGGAAARAAPPHDHAAPPRSTHDHAAPAPAARDPR